MTYHNITNIFHSASQKIVGLINKVRGKLFQLLSPNADKTLSYNDDILTMEYGNRIEVHLEIASNSSGL